MEPDNRIWANPDLLQIWLWCLLKANYKDKRWVSFKSGKGRVDVELKKGQFVCGRHSAGDELQINPSTVRSRLKKLEALGYITINPDKQFTVITVCDYEYYQGRDGSEMPTNSAPIKQPIDKADTTTKNVKKLKKEKNKNNNTISLNLETWEYENISDEQMSFWIGVYPTVNIPAELKRSAAWVQADGRRRKKNWKTFLNNWFATAQSRPHKVEKSVEERRAELDAWMEGAVARDRAEGVEFQDE